MNKETLKYYTALQPLFKKKMGEWYCGDAYVDKKFSAVIQYITPHHLQQRTSMGSNIRIPETINQVRKGQIDPRVANAVGYLANVLIRAVEQGDLEKRLDDLEAVVKNQRSIHDADLSMTGTDA